MVYKCRQTKWYTALLAYLNGSFTLPYLTCIRNEILQYSTHNNSYLDTLRNTKLVLKTFSLQLIQVFSRWYRYVRMFFHVDKICIVKFGQYKKNVYHYVQLIPEVLPFLPILKVTKPKSFFGSQNSFLVIEVLYEQCKQWSHHNFIYVLPRL